MIRMFTHHSVSDYPRWKKTYDDFDQERRKMGVTSDAVFQAAENPDDVTVWHDFKTLEEARTFADSKRLKEVMAQAGVAGTPEIWFTKT